MIATFLNRIQQGVQSRYCMSGANPRSPASGMLAQLVRAAVLYTACPWFESMMFHLR